MNENTPKKTRIPKAVRVLALILALLFAAEIIFSNATAISFSSKKYADSDYEQAAEVLERNDSYLTAGRLSRMRSVISMIGEPKTYEQFSLFASVAIADEEYAKAADYLSKAVPLYSGDDKGLAADYVKIGCLKALCKSWDTASTWFEKAIELDGENHDAWLMLCQARLNQGRYEDALSALETYSSFRGLSPLEYEALIQLQTALGKYDEALASCDIAEANGSAAADIALYRAQLYYTKGEIDTALAQAEASRKAGGDPAGVNAIIALCHESREDFAKASAAWQELINSGKADVSIYQQAAQDAYLASDLDTVIRVSEDALKKFGENEDTLVFKKWLGVSYFEKNDLAKAEVNLTAMLESGESMPELNYLRGICEMGSEKYEAAVADFTASLLSEELIDEALYNRGLCRIKLGNTDEAAADFQEVIDRNKKPEVIDLICDLLQISRDQLEAESETK